MLCSESKLQQTLICHLLCLYYSTSGLRVFVLHMRSPKLFFDGIECSDYMKNFTLPSVLLNQTAYGYSINAFGQNFTCERHGINYYIHIDIQEKKEDEEKVLKSMESSVTSEIKSLNSFTEFLKQHQINGSDISFRSTVVCPEEIVMLHDYKTTWPTTLIGHSTHSEELCVGGNGKVIERECLGDFDTGAYWGLIQGECADVSSKLTVNLYKLSKIKITKHNILNTSSKMAALASTSKDMSSADTQYIAQILRNMATVPTIHQEVLISVIRTVDQVIGAEHLRIKHEKSISNVSSKVLFAVENMLSNFNANGRVFKTAGSNLALSVFSPGFNSSLVRTGGILESWNSSITALFNGTGRNEPFSTFDDFEAGISLPENVVFDFRKVIGEDLAIAIYKNFQYVENIEVVSPVVDVFIGSRTVYGVDPPIQLVFKVPQMKQNTTYDCVFWDPYLNDSDGGWSNKGCISHYLDSTHMRCCCDHLTSFAVISEVRHSETIIIIFAKGALYIGWISLQFGLLIILLTFILFRQYRKQLKHKVLFNLSLSLFLFMLTLSAGLERRNSTAFGCAVAAVVLHYLMFSCFAWMVVEAFIQYHTLVKVIGTYIPRFMQKASLFGWGLPLVNIVVLLSTDYKIYISRTKLCWPKVWVIDKAFYYGVAAQAATMWIMTLVVFVLILHSTCGRNNKGLRTHQNEKKAKIARAQAIFCVSVLLGISWIYGVVHVYANYFAIQYIYAATLTLLGIFIFIYFVFVCKETRKLWLSLFNNTILTTEISHIDVSISRAEQSTDRRSSN